MSAPVTAAACRVCTAELHPDRLTLGAQPLCNRFLRAGEEPGPTFPLTLGVCPDCGVMQLVEAAPASEIAPRFDWITYNEAEGHLDDLVARLRRLGAWSPGAVVGGTSYKDTTMLARIAAAGAATWEVDAADLDLPARRVEIDAVQDRLDGRRAQAIAGRRASADLLLVRHVLEHAHDLPGFLRAMTSLVKPGGWLVFEVPDASAMLALRDYSPLWEEHVTYFTPATLPGALAHHGLQPVETVTYPYPFENAVVVVARRGPAPDVDAAPGATPSGAAPAALAYFRGFETARRRQWEALAAERAAGRRIALLGAGHLACTWLNLLGAGSALDCVIDDDPRRAGLRMPGSGLPIVGSAALQERGIDLCLLGVNPLVEDRVVERHQPFVARGGIFRSIFPVSPRALTREVP